MENTLEDLTRIACKAAIEGNTEKLEALLGMDRSLVTRKDDAGNTIATLAVFNRNWDVVEMLSEKYPESMFVRDGEGHHPSDLCVQDEVDDPCKVADLPGWREKLVQIEQNKLEILHTAIRAGYTDQVKVILENNPALAYEQDDGFTPAGCASILGKKEVLEEILKVDRVLASRKDKYGNTPAIYATFSRNWDVVEMLRTQYPESFLVRDGEGNRPSDLCVQDEVDDPRKVADLPGWREKLLKTEREMEKKISRGIEVDELVPNKPA